MSSLDLIKIAENRAATQSLKWQKYSNSDILPMWVADSDFQCAQPILDALHKRISHGALGYHNPYHYEGGLSAIQHWLASRYDWHVETDWIVWTPGVVPAFNMVCQAFCEPGDGVLVQEPNYPPILNAPKLNGLIQEKVTTVWANNRWQLDFADLENKAAKPSTKLFLLCNPMNPCGSVYTQSELNEIERICLKHNVMLCSDEIHADLILDPSLKHIPAGSLESIGEQAVTLMAASKTFNVAGFGVSFAIIKCPKVRARFKRVGQGIAPSANNLGVIATVAAFTECDDWYEAQLKYLRNNQQRFANALEAIPSLEYQPSAATYLAWVNCEKLKQKDLQGYLESLGLGPSPGKDFGWPKYARFNLACSQDVLNEAVARLQQVTSSQ